MKKIIAIASLLLLCAASSNAAFIYCTNIVDAFFNGAGFSTIRFTPQGSNPQRYEDTTILPKVVSTNLYTNTLRDTEIRAGGLYWVTFLPSNSYVPRYLALVPPNTTNRYSLNQIFEFATNKTSFVWTNNPVLVTATNFSGPATGLVAQIATTVVLSNGFFNYVTNGDQFGNIWPAIRSSGGYYSGVGIVNGSLMRGNNVVIYTTGSDSDPSGIIRGGLDVYPLTGGSAYFHSGPDGTSSGSDFTVNGSSYTLGSINVWDSPNEVWRAFTGIDGGVSFDGEISAQSFIGDLIGNANTASAGWPTTWPDSAITGQISVTNVYFTNRSDIIVTAQRKLAVGTNNLGMNQTTFNTMMGKFNLAGAAGTGFTLGSINPSFHGAGAGGATYYGPLSVFGLVAMDDAGQYASFIALGSINPNMPTIEWQTWDSVYVGAIFPEGGMVVGYTNFPNKTVMTNPPSPGSLIVTSNLNVFGSISGSGSGISNIPPSALSSWMNTNLALLCVTNGYFTNTTTVTRTTDNKLAIGTNNFGGAGSAGSFQPPSQNLTNYSLGLNVDNYYIWTTNYSNTNLFPNSPFTVTFSTNGTYFFEQQMLAVGQNSTNYPVIQWMITNVTSAGYISMDGMVHPSLNSGMSQQFEGQAVGGTTYQLNTANNGFGSGITLYQRSYNLTSQSLAGRMTAIITITNAPATIYLTIASGGGGGTSTNKTTIQAGSYYNLKRIF